MKVYGVAVSPFVRKTHVVLNLKGLEYEQVHAIPGEIPPEMQAFSPLGKIPAFEDGDLKFSDSSVICEYLDEQYPDVSTRPATPALRAKSRWIEEYADSKLMELCGGGIFFQKIVKPLILKEEPDEERVKETLENLLPQQFDYIESIVPEEGFLFGEFGVADISLVSPIINIGYADVFVDQTRWPKLFAFVERVKAHPSVVKALTAEIEIINMLKGQ